MIKVIEYPLRVLWRFKFDIKSLVTYVLLSKIKKYAFFQKYYYNHYARKSDYKREVKKDFLVGSYEQQDDWKDYDICLFKHVDESYKQKLALDFGCGPCRNAIKYYKIFKRLDGVDISEVLIEKGKENLNYHKIPIPKLYVNNGYDLSEIPSETYDFLISTICMQHICVHSTRFNLFTEFYRVLKNGGWISIQMGYGKDSPQTVDYYTDSYTALLTNRGCDAKVESPDQLRKDLEKIGFKNFEYNIRPTGPGDSHPNWIFFQAQK